MSLDSQPGRYIMLCPGTLPGYYVYKANLKKSNFDNLDWEKDGIIPTKIWRDTLFIVYMKAGLGKVHL